MIGAKRAVVIDTHHRSEVGKFGLGGGKAQAGPKFQCKGNWGCLTPLFQSKTDGGGGGPMNEHGQSGLCFLLSQNFFNPPKLTRNAVLGTFGAIIC